jgi:hypothetical protein
MLIFMRFIFVLFIIGVGLAGILMLSNRHGTLPYSHTPKRQGEVQRQLQPGLEKNH